MGIHVCVVVGHVVVDAMCEDSGHKKASLHFLKVHEYYIWMLDHIIYDPKKHNFPCLLAKTTNEMFIVYLYQQKRLRILNASGKNEGKAVINQGKAAIDTFRWLRTRGDEAGGSQIQEEKIGCELHVRESNPYQTMTTT